MKLEESAGSSRVQITREGEVIPWNTEGSAVCPPLDRASCLGPAPSSRPGSPCRGSPSAAPAPCDRRQHRHPSRASGPPRQHQHPPPRVGRATAPAPAARQGAWGGRARARTRCRRAAGCSRRRCRRPGRAPASAPAPAPASRTRASTSTSGTRPRQHRHWHRARVCGCGGWVCGGRVRAPRACLLAISAISVTPGVLVGEKRPPPALRHTADRDQGFADTGLVS